jgi:cation:H+ antiporter
MVIAFGTSLPELFVSTEAVLFGDFDIAVGNIVGSNIANIGLILALCAVLKPEVFRSLPHRGSLIRSAALLLATSSSLVLIIRGILDVLSGILFLAVFAFMVQRFPPERTAPSVHEAAEEQDRLTIHAGRIGKL